MRLFGWLRKPAISEAERGIDIAKELLATNPSQQLINSWWSCACEDAGFARDPSFANGVKSVLRPHRAGNDTRPQKT